MVPTIIPTGEATGILPVQDGAIKPITFIGTAASRDTFDEAGLRQAINSLARLLGPAALEATRTTVMLRPEAVPTDRERFLASLQ